MKKERTEDRTTSKEKMQAGMKIQKKKRKRWERRRRRRAGEDKDERG